MVVVSKKLLIVPNVDIVYTTIELQMHRRELRSHFHSVAFTHATEAVAHGALSVRG